MKHPFLVTGLAALSLVAFEATFTSNIQAGWCGGTTSTGSASSSGTGVSRGHVIPLEKLREGGYAVEWFDADKSVFEAAKRDQLPIILGFFDADLDHWERYFASEGMTKYSRENARFVSVRISTAAVVGEDGGEAEGEPKPSRVEEPKDTQESIVPVDRVRQEDLLKTYGAKLETMIVCDPYGNPLKVFSEAPKVDALKSEVAKVSKVVETNAKRLDKRVERAKQALAKNELSDFLRESARAFKYDLRGYKSIEELVKTYSLLIEETRSSIEDAVSELDLSAIEKIQKNFGSSELKSELEIARAKVQAQKAVEDKASK